MLENCLGFPKGYQYDTTTPAPDVGLTVGDIMKDA